MYNTYILLTAAMFFLLIVMVILFIRNYRLRKLYMDQMITFNAIFNSLPDLIYCKDVNRKFTDINEACKKFFSVSDKDVLGKSIREVHNDLDQADRLLEADEIVIKEKRTIKTAEWYIFPNNVKRLMENTKVPLIRNGKVIGLVGIDRDITDDKIAIDNAYEESRSKSNFLAKMSHEIRTPMNAIIGMTELALREKEPELIHKHIYTVKQAGTHLLSLINDILDFSKIERGKLEIIPGDYMFSSLANDVISIIRMKLIDSQIRFAVNVDSNIPNELFGDETRVRQVLLNILSNAVKYTERGFISFSVCFDEIDNDNINLVIEVMDTGRGIKQEHIDKLFNEYEQVDQEKNKGIEGIGLGLAITWSLTRAMGGDIQVYSEYGKGSIFTLIIPQKKRSNKILAKIYEPESKSVIVYERREIYANSIVYSILNMGVKCTLVESDTELSEKLANGKFEFLFISYVLMRRNIDIINKYAANTKIVILTEFGEAIPSVNLNIISMPVYAISIANILNGVAESFNYNENKGYVIKFVAPMVKILIVDDINTNLKVAEGLMLPYKMKIDLCKSGKEAINAIKEKRYDLIFMDHKMPEMDGVEATTIIRSMSVMEDYYGSVPIIALTANAIGNMKEMFLQNGFNDFLSKPIDIVKLNLILEKWIPLDKKNTVHKSSYKNIANNAAKNIVIEGFDIEKGIHFSGGNFDSYLDTLAIFHKDGLKEINKLNLYLESQNMDMYNINIHAIKSALANIGAFALSEEAKSLEEASGRYDNEYIKINNILFINKLKIALNEIEIILAKNELIDENDGKAGIGVIIPILHKLSDAIESLNAGIINSTIEELIKMKHPANLKNKINDISELILIGEYDEATGIIKSIINEEV